ncbi:MAG TPA: hypothetical protein VEU47_13205 [Candidatus Cybelea sp.]|nr:hypothetical protein [Candidatus Cybelea sp.]
MTSPYLQRPVRSLKQAVEEIALVRGVSPESLYLKSTGAEPLKPGRNASAPEQNSDRSFTPNKR